MKRLIQRWGTTLIATAALTLVLASLIDSAVRSGLSSDMASEEQAERAEQFASDAEQAMKVERRAMQSGEFN